MSDYGTELLKRQLNGEREADRGHWFTSALDRCNLIYTMYKAANHFSLLSYATMSVGE